MKNNPKWIHEVSNWELVTWGWPDLVEVLLIMHFFYYLLVSEWAQEKWWFNFPPAQKRLHQLDRDIVLTNVFKSVQDSGWFLSHDISADERRVPILKIVMDSSLLASDPMRDAFRQLHWHSNKWDVRRSENKVIDQTAEARKEITPSYRDISQWNIIDFGVIMKMALVSRKEVGSYGRAHAPRWNTRESNRD